MDIARDPVTYSCSSQYLNHGYENIQIATELPLLFKEYENATLSSLFIQGHRCQVFWTQCASRDIPTWKLHVIRKQLELAFKKKGGGGFRKTGEMKF